MTTTLAGGCFWCTEAIFENLSGVQKLLPGYMGGHIENPSYDEVCSGSTGHAEVIQIEYDEKKIDFSDLLGVFFKTHDPTTLNRQGNDVGTQYRSAIFYHNKEQQAKALEFIKQLNDEQIFSAPIVTEIVPAETFYPAEHYHVNYYKRNPNQPYCAVVIKPKLDKFLKSL